MSTTLNIFPVCDGAKLLIIRKIPSCFYQAINMKHCSDNQNTSVIKAVMESSWKSTARTY